MRRAFVMGSNGPEDLNPLRFARRDAERMRTRLSSSQCGFEVSMPRTGTKVDEAENQLRDAALACAPDDTFVAYFSGHGLIDRGELFLLWDDSRRDSLLNSSLPAADVLRALRFCPANNKLLILDCCHAGTIVHMLGLRDADVAARAPVTDTMQAPDNHLVLMASDRLQKARELEELRGGFLTIALLSALGEEDAGRVIGDYGKDDDGDGRISTRDLERWLPLAARDYNRTVTKDRAVPSPYIFGQRRGELYLTLSDRERPSYELSFDDGTTLLVLPISLGRRDPWTYRNDHNVVALGKYPVTNAQYGRFVSTGLGEEPVGETRIGPFKWGGPFYPWREQGFKEPDKPVVCVSLYDARKYCKWVSNTVKFAHGSRQGSLTCRLPTHSEWDLAAFGTTYPPRDRRAWTQHPSRVRSQSRTPIDIDRGGERADNWGLSDLFGNVWQWCDGAAEEWVDMEAAAATFPPAELRGGGPFDDLERVKPFVEAHRLRQVGDTRHSDVGFRIAATIAKNDLPPEIRIQLGF